MLEYLPLAVTAPEASLIGAATTAVLAAAVALYLNAIGRKAEERGRRRDLYSEAYRTALQWCEGVYRVRRRPADGSGDRELVVHFHEMQERIAYYEGWLAFEAPELGRAYSALLRDLLRIARSDELDQRRL
jgi:hypothetical protein